MRVFQEITYDIQRAFIERRAGVKTGMVLTHEAGVPGPDREFNPDQPAGAGKIASDPPSSTAVGQALGQQEGGSAWDRLRQTDGRAAADPSAARRAGTTPSLGGSTPGLGGSTPNLGGTTPSLGGNSASTEAEYARRQKDFDAMLERERKGGDDRDKW